jgi:hypothetical protein
MARELAFETIRATLYPHLPSRLSCCFVFESLEHANHYASNSSPWNSLYEVELVTPTAAMHRAGFNLVSLPPADVEFLPVVTALARAYWAGQRIEAAEIITESPLRIVHLVSGAPAGYQPIAAPSTP